MNGEHNLIRTLLYRVFPICGVIFIGYVLIGPQVCSFMGGSAGKKTMTLARLNNLKAAMALLSSMPEADVIFPESEDELMEVLRDYLEMPEAERSKILIDGWGKAMRFEGDWEDYTVRSAGRDRAFDTDDDIYLKGNPSGEYVMDLSARRTLSAGSLKRVFNPLPFQEPTGYYEISLPGRYIVMEEYRGHESEITFYYAQGNLIRITAHPDNDSTATEERMQKRLAVLLDGWDEELEGFRPGDSGLIDFAGGEGYYIDMESESGAAREYFVNSGYYMSVTILIRSSGEDSREIMDILSYAVESELIIH